MSYVGNENETQEFKKSYVVTYKELIFTIFIFVVILVSLYPKDLLKEQIMNEKANYDLSMLYLKNLLKHNPDDESFMLILAKQSLKTGKVDLAVRLSELLFQSKNKTIRQQALLLSYDLEKQRYFQLNDDKLKQEQFEKLKTLYHKIESEDIFDKEDIQKLYDEAIFVGDKEKAYKLVGRLVQEHPNDPKLLKEAFYLTSEFGSAQQAAQYLERLRQCDTGKDKDQWVLAEYYMLMKQKDYKSAEKLLEKHQNDNPHIKEVLAELYAFQKEYVKSSNLYLELYQDASDFKIKKEYFQKAVATLIGAGKTAEVNKLINEHGSDFMEDKEMRQFMLKTYLANGKLEDAAALSKKILRLKYIK